MNGHPTGLELDTAHSVVVTEHPFQPDHRGWWGLCSHVDEAGNRCRLAESAHAKTAIGHPAHGAPGGRSLA